jgi:hypothetical protein
VTVRGKKNKKPQQFKAALGKAHSLLNELYLVEHRFAFRCEALFG